MKILSVVCACALMVSSPAWACRGTAEYPEVMVKLAKADLPAAEKALYKKQLDNGKALHDRGHERDDMGLRKESLEILDRIKVKVGI